MPGSRIALRLVAHGGAFGVREELIGDLLEEIARGRTRAWLCQQLIGLYGYAFLTGVRRRSRLTPPLIACGMGLTMLVAASIASARTVLVMWLGFYYVAGMLSLFAHMASPTVSAGERALSERSQDAPG